MADVRKSKQILLVLIIPLIFSLMRVARLALREVRVVFLTRKKI